MWKLAWVQVGTAVGFSKSPPGSSRERCGMRSGLGGWIPGFGDQGLCIEAFCPGKEGEGLGPGGGQEEEAKPSEEEAGFHFLPPLPFLPLPFFLWCFFFFFFAFSTT